MKVNNFNWQPNSLHYCKQFPTIPSAYFGYPKLVPMTVKRVGQYYSGNKIKVSKVQGTFRYKGGLKTPLRFFKESTKRKGENDKDI